MTVAFGTPARTPTGDRSAPPLAVGEHASATAAEATVYDAMVRQAKTCPARATVADVRRLFDDPHVHAALVLGHDHTLLAVVERADLKPAIAGTEVALRFGCLDGRTTTADVPLISAHQAMSATARRRLAVIDDKRQLLGLLCLKASGVGFCSDRDVHDRSLAPHPGWTGATF